jgi:hypothetical protein
LMREVNSCQKDQGVQLTVGSDWKFWPRVLMLL